MQGLARPCDPSIFQHGVAVIIHHIGKVRETGDLTLDVIEKCSATIAYYRDVVLPSFPLVSYESEIKRKERSGQIGPKYIKLCPINLITIVQNIFILCADVLVLVQYIVHRRLTCIARARAHTRCMRM